MAQKYCWRDTTWIDGNFQDCGECDQCKAKRQRDAAAEIAKGGK